MRKLLLLLLMLGLLSIAALGHGEEKVGILVDAKCGAVIAGDVKKAEAHTISCSLENRETGYGIIVDGKFLPFDEYGNKQAVLLLKVTEQESNLKVRVGGHFEKDVVIVSEIETVSE